MQRRLNDLVTVGPQVFPDDLPGLKERGFRVVVAVRPDGEMPGQPTANAMREAAEALDLAFEHLPVSSGIVNPPDVQRFAELLAAGEPIMAYCGSGPRAVLLASLAGIVNGQSVDAVMETAAEAGFDLSPAIGLLEAYASAREEG